MHQDPQICLLAQIFESADEDRNVVKIVLYFDTVIVEALER